MLTFTPTIQSICAVDWGSIAHTKRGTAGNAPEEDKFPFFNRTATSWLYILWDAEPGEWLLVFPERRLDEYPDILNEIPAENKIPLSDITDVYLELMPSTSFRVYLSPSGSGTGVAREESTRSNALGQEAAGPGEEQKDKEKDSPHGVFDLGGGKGRQIVTQIAGQTARAEDHAAAQRARPRGHVGGRDLRGDAAAVSRARRRSMST
jgi:hypothetical protein